jgi:hypothetical protein
MEGFLEKGFRVVNSYYPYTYTDHQHYICSEKMKTWNAYKAPSGQFVQTDLILGGEGCAWEFGNYEGFPFYGYVVPPVLAILGDKLWDTSDREQDAEYRKALSEYLFGNDDMTCIFDAVGEMIPPRSKTKFVEPKSEMPTEEAVNLCLAKLKTVKNTNCLLTAQKFIWLFEKIAEQIANQ